VPSFVDSLRVVSCDPAHAPPRPLPLPARRSLCPAIRIRASLLPPPRPRASFANAVLFPAKVRMGPIGPQRILTSANFRRFLGMIVSFFFFFLFFFFLLPRSRRSFALRNRFRSPLLKLWPAVLIVSGAPCRPRDVRPACAWREYEPHASREKPSSCPVRVSDGWQVSQPGAARGRRSGSCVLPVPGSARAVPHTEKRFTRQQIFPVNNGLSLRVSIGVYRVTDLFLGSRQRAPAAHHLRPFYHPPWRFFARLSFSSSFFSLGPPPSIAPRPNTRVNALFFFFSFAPARHLRDGRSLSSSLVLKKLLHPAGMRPHLSH